MIFDVVFQLCCSTACPDNWLMYQTHCYFFETDKKYSVDASKTQCAQRGGQLAMVETLDEHNFLVNHMTQQFTTKIFWIDLTSPPGSKGISITL